jgi:hypothetical protein
VWATEKLRVTSWLRVQASRDLEAKWWRRGPRTTGRSGTSACTRGLGTASRRGRARATSCAGALVCKHSLTYPFALAFSPVFKIEVVQTLNTNVAQQVTLYKNVKSSRRFYPLVWAKTVVQVDQNLGAREQSSSACFCIFHTLPLQTRELCALQNCTFFPLSGFEVFREILENVLKF